MTDGDAPSVARAARKTISAKIARMTAREFRFDDFRLLPAARELWRAGVREKPARLVLDCLVYLVEHRDRAVGRDEMVAAVWGRVDVAEARVSELMVRARRAVGDDGQAQRVIRTVPGFGYRWVVPTEAVDVESEAPKASLEPPADAPHEAAISGVAASDRAVPIAGEAADDAPTGMAKPIARSPAKRRIPIAIALVLIAILVAFATWRLRDPATLPQTTATTPADSQSLVVLPFEVDAPPEAAWARLGIMELVADRLRRADVAVLASERTLAALRGSDGAPLAPAQLRERLGANGVVRGSVRRDFDGWQVSLQVDDARGGVHSVDSRDADLIEAALRAADLLLAALDRAPPAADSDDMRPEEHLRRIQAALLASDVPAAKLALDQTPEALRSDWRIGYAAARVDFFAGDFERAAASFTGLLDMPAVQADPVARSRVLAARATVAFRQSRPEIAERDYRDAAALLAPGEAQAERGTALSGLGISLIAQQRYDEAAVALGRARTAFRAAGDRYGLAQVDTNLGLLEAERGRLEQALPHLVDAADRFEALGAVERRLAVLGTVLDVQVGLLRWRDALATSDRQWVLREAIGDPGLGATVASGRAAVLLGLGRHRDAQALLDAAERDYADVQPAAAHYLPEQRAELQARLGQSAAVLATVATVLADWPDEPRDLARAHLLLLRERAEAASGIAGEGFSDIPVDLEIGSAATALLVAAAESAARRGDDARAEALFGRALATADVDGVPSQVALAATAFGHWRLARGEEEAAAALAGRVAAWAERDFDCALLQLAVFQAIGPREPWADSLRQVEDLAGERVIPPKLRLPPTR